MGGALGPGRAAGGGCKLGGPTALIALDPTAEVIAEARDRGCRILIVHHPLLFRPLARLVPSDPVAASALTAAKARVAAGLVVIDASHFATERPFLQHLAARLADGARGEVVVSEIRTDPWEG